MVPRQALCVACGIALAVVGPVFASVGAPRQPIRTLAPPPMACEIRSMAGDGEALYFLDKCDAILRWNPQSGERTAVELDGAPFGLRELAVGKNRLAVLERETQVVWVFDKAGDLVGKHAYPGESRVFDIAVLGDYVAMTSWFDDHLLFVFHQAGEPPRMLIQNPQYWPEAAPRYRSEADLAVDGNKFVVVDRNNYAVFTIDPAQTTVERHDKERYPGAPVFEKPVGTWGTDPGLDHYTGILKATSSTVVDGEVFLVMLDRRVTDMAGYDEHYLEVASSAHDEVAWARRAELSDLERFAGSDFPAIIGDTMYLYMHKDEVVHAVPIHR